MTRWMRDRRSYRRGLDYAERGRDGLRDEAGGGVERVGLGDAEEAFPTSVRVVACRVECACDVDW
jgi:hypothetical protein